MQTQKLSSLLRIMPHYVMLFTLVLVLAGCQSSKQPTSSFESSSSVMTTEGLDESSQTEPTRVTMRSIGDILIHDTVYWDAAQEDGTYNFDHMFEAVRPYLENADITTANLEVIAGGDVVGVSTYPFFSAPVEIIDALKRVGIDIVNNATNHTVDFGAEGALASIQALQDRDMMYVGSYESWDDYNQRRIIEAKGIKFGFLSYAYGSNGNYIPEGMEYLLSLIDTELIPLEIERLHQQADVSVVMIHNGEEYSYYPSDYQVTVNQVALDAGANYILGGHPHYVQPFFRENKQQVGWYSHGNFLHGQYDLPTKVGAIGEVTFLRDSQGEISIENLRLMPTFCIGLPETWYYKVVPLADLAEYSMDGSWMFEEIKELMQTYTEVEVVEYLD